MEITLEVKSITLIVKFDSAYPITVELPNSCICFRAGQVPNFLEYLLKLKIEFASTVYASLSFL